MTVTRAAPASPGAGTTCSSRGCRARPPCSRKEDALAIHRLRLIIATLAALLVPAALAGPAPAAHVRVEGKSKSIFQGNARPFVGTLKGHTTTKQTALGSLVTASRTQPFALGLIWSDCCGGALGGF